MKQPIYDPAKTFEDNFEHGPFGAFADGKVFTNPGEPKYEVFGKKVYLPFGIGAGPLPNSRFVKAAFDKGFDVVCYKTQRSTVFPSNPFPNILFVDVDGDLTIEKAQKPLIGKTTTDKDATQFSITNSFANPSKGPQFWVEDLKRAIAAQRKGQLLIVSVVGTIKDGFSQADYYKDFADTAKMAYDAGAPVIELNLACPNVASEGVLCYTHDAVVEICRLTRAVVGKTPLVVKLGYYTPEQQELLETIITDILSFIQGISVINTIAAPIVDEQGKQALPGQGRLKSGVCGASIKWAGIDMVKRLAALRKKLHASYTIIGIGGVMSPADYHEYRDVGADVVQSATAAIWNPYLAQEIKQAVSKG